MKWKSIILFPLQCLTMFLWILAIIFTAICEALEDESV